MCHSYHGDWHAAAEEYERILEEPDEPPEPEEEPSFIEEEAAEDVELLTDGGEGD
jgi:hypothetical protein